MAHYYDATAGGAAVAAAGAAAWPPAVAEGWLTETTVAVPAGEATTAAAGASLQVLHLQLPDGWDPAGLQTADLPAGEGGRPGGGVLSTPHGPLFWRASQHTLELFELGPSNGAVAGCVRIVRALGRV